MKQIKFLPVALAAALTLGFTSCSDDNDEPNAAPGNETSTVNPSTVFTAGVPSQVGDAVITKNAEGLVTKIVDGDQIVTFDYAPAKSRAEVNIPTDYDMTMKVEWGNDEDGVDFYIKLNKEGFVEYAYEVDESKIDGDTAEEWWFEYDSAGRMVKMKRTEGDDEVTTVTYNSAGDIVDVKVSDNEYPNGKMQCTIAYTNEANATAIVNKSGIMLYDASFCIDMDEMAPAYFAGLLGKGTAHLPLGASETNIEDCKTEYTFVWTLNSNQMPIRFNSTYISYYPWADQPYDGEDDPVNFKW
ncbi:MAG: DUF4595 domain-containing protein [Bacteroides sp.]|nr:DUF4595 domain-containing protein [Bacteroides sp.]MBD5422744.1 DUF4595 domain-containing protein [Bacteroides sp.]